MRSQLPNYKVIVRFINSHVGEIEREFKVSASGPDQCRRMALSVNGTEHIRRYWTEIEVFYIAYGMQRDRRAGKDGVLELHVQTFKREQS